jgi:hypothetical protein
MTEPTNWEDAASIALGEVFETLATLDVSAVDLETLRDALDAFIMESFGKEHTPAEVSAAYWRNIGAEAVALSGTVTGEILSMDECWKVLCAKQYDYGPNNILRFSRPGLPGGLLVRCWDKVARLLNLRDRGVAPQNESLRDSFLDLTNYAAIGLMVERDWFLLPLNPPQQ